MPLNFVSKATVFWNSPYPSFSHMVTTIVPFIYLLPINPLQLSPDVGFLLFSGAYFVRQRVLFIRFYFIHFSRLNSISIILFWENTGNSVSKNYQIIEISNNFRYSSSNLTLHLTLPYFLPYLTIPYVLPHLTLLYI